MDFTPLQRTETPKIFNDYLKNLPQATNFYPAHFQSNFLKLLALRASVGASRERLSEILHQQNQQWTNSPRVAENIDKLKNNKTLAVVTGQQAGMLGGPLYTFYKIMTAVKYCQKLAREYPDFQFVPIFWMEVNDSDFAEIATIYYLNKENELKTLVAQEEPAEQGWPIALRKIPESLKNWREEIDNDFYDTEFKAAAIEQFFAPYQTSTLLKDAFAKLIAAFFAPHGVVIFDPSDTVINQLATPIYQKAIQQNSRLIKQLIRRSQEIEAAGYSPQIHINPQQTLLFYTNAKNRRLRIDQGENGFVLHDEQPVNLSVDELLSAEVLQCLSPNVALRPLIQDWVLPTAAYVAGPSEVAYLAQVAVLYEVFEMPMPVIVPRHRMTLVESKIQKQIEKYKLDVAEILENHSDYIDRIFQKSVGQEIFQLLNSTNDTIADSLLKLEKRLKEMDPTLVASLEKTRQNIEGSFGKLNQKVTRSIEQNNEIMVRQLEKVLLNLMPQNNFQERVFSVVYFSIKYGLNFWDKLMGSLPEDPVNHYIIKL
jgi:bacillithiol biosynthesis cysteine-adding enzyme BshC